MVRLYRSPRPQEPLLRLILYQENWKETEPNSLSVGSLGTRTSERYYDRTEQTNLQRTQGKQALRSRIPTYKGPLSPRYGRGATVVFRRIRLQVATTPVRIALFFKDAYHPSCCSSVPNRKQTPTTIFKKSTLTTDPIHIQQLGAVTLCNRPSTIGASTHPTGEPQPGRPFWTLYGAS